MYINCCFYLFLCGLAVCMAETVTFSIGNIGQYVGSAASTPTLTGSIIEFDGDGQADNGLDVFLSTDLQNNINAALDSNCGELNDQCFQSMRDSLMNDDTELYSRQDPATLTVGALVVGFASLLFPFYYQDKEPIPVPIQLDPSHVSAASALATASAIVIVPESGAPITITPSPNPPAVTGADAPSISTVTDAISGYNDGDVIITLPHLLASRMDELIAITSNTCPEGDRFTTQKLRKRLDNYGAVICAAETLVINAAPGGPFPELLVLQPQPFPWTAADAVRAMNVVIAFARTQAPDLALTTDQAAAVGVAAFAIAWEIFINGNRLSDINVIPADSLEETTTTTTTEAPCPTEYCNAACTMIGAIAKCRTTCVTPTATSCSASSTPIQVTTTATIPWTVSVNDLEASPTPSFYARILPLGASIVWGVGSSTGNGFRKPLRDSLRQAGWMVNMVGSKNNGDFIDNNVEAHSGDRIDQIQEASKLSTKYQPNVVLINGGTNDCLQSYDIPNFTNRYNSLLDSLYSAIPNVTIICSTVIPGTANGIPQNRDAVNGQIKALVNDRQNNGQKIVLADVDFPSGFLTTEYLISDGIHPTDEGHQRLASIYLEAFENANDAGYISSPAITGQSDDSGSGGDTTCDKTYGSGAIYGPVNTQEGSGLDDGPYVHDSKALGVVFDSSYNSDYHENYTFARLQEPFGYHDLVHIGDVSDNQRRYEVYYNTGCKFSSDINEFYIGDTCIARGVRFVDVNADGLDDMVCIALNGDTYVHINAGKLGFIDGGLWKPNEGSPQSRVRLADIDGDGRADYCTIADNGDITCWRNGGQGDHPEYWQPLGIIFTGKGFGDVDGVRFFDLNGDGRDDWLWVDDTGKTWTYTNNRGCKTDTLEPLWRPGSNKDGGDYTHAGMGHYVGRDAIYFAKVCGVPEAFSLGGRADYVWIETSYTQTTSGPGLWQYHFNLWQNLGSGATKLKADGDRYCNMLGHANGAMDYVWVHSTGYMILYESFGGTFPPEPPYWGPHYQIWAASDFYGSDIDRRDLHLADWDGDGLCDIIYVNPDNGEMDVWLNQYKNGGDITKWTHVSDAGPRGTLTPCLEKRGVGIYDLAVRFADIDGNGRADYLCIEKDGRTWGYLNNDDGGLTYISQFKKTEDKDRANLRWVDVNGDGRDDLLWVDKFNGDATVWYNEGPIPASGSAYTWSYQGPLYEGTNQGSCMHYPDLNGDGRADMTFVDSLTNTATTWFNMCPGEGGSDNGDDPDTLTSAPVPFLYY